MYYDGTKLLSQKDINGNTPEIFMCTTNRTGGKTTFFGRLCVNRYKDGGGKFALLYRYNYELDECANKFYKDIGALFFPNTTMRSERRAGGIFHEMFLDDKSCGYAISLNSAEQIKKYSHFFSDVNRIIFDEFQSETNNYCPNEIRKFQSIHQSIARGQGKQVRYVPVYMLANTVSILNPYYTAMGISKRLKSTTKFLRGNGFVLEQGYVESASLAQQESGFNKAFMTDSYQAYSTQNIYLNDNSSFVSKPSGNSKYICTIKCYNKHYAVREYIDEGIIFCDNTPDMSFPVKLAVTTADHNINYIMLKRNRFLLDTLKYYFDNGCFRFNDLESKEAILTALSY